MSGPYGAPDAARAAVAIAGGEGIVAMRGGPLVDQRPAGVLRTGPPHGALGVGGLEAPRL